MLVGFIFAAFWPLVSKADSEVRRFKVEIRNIRGEPIGGVRVKCRGHSEFSDLSTATGLTYLPLPPGLQHGDPVRIELEPGTDYAKQLGFLKPIEGSLNVPSPKQPFFEITLAPQELLESLFKNARKFANKARDATIDQFDRPSPPLGKNREQRH